MKSWVFLAFAYLPEVFGDRSFKISLANLDSNKSLLEQIYERAESMGFDFKGLSSHHIKLSDSLLSDGKSEAGDASGGGSGAKSKNESQKASEKSKDNSKGQGSKKESTAVKNKTKNKAVAANNESEKAAKAQSKSAKAKSAEASKSKTKSAKGNKAAKSSVSKSISKTVSSPKNKRNKSTTAMTKSAKGNSDKKSSTYNKNSSATVHKSKSKNSTIHSSESIGKKKSKSASSHPASIEGIRSKTASATISSSKSKENVGEDSVQQSLSTLGSQSFSSSNPTSTVDVSSATSSDISSSTASLSIPSSILPNNEVLDKINSLSPDVVQSVMGTCTQCAKVNDILVYKDGDVYRDYFNKIEMRNVNGVLQDKSGAFMGKDCSCKKEKIPELGTVGPTGLVQDKEISYEECQSQSVFMSQLASAAAQSMISTESNTISPQSSAFVQSENQNSIYNQNAGSSGQTSLSPGQPASSFAEVSSNVNNYSINSTDQFAQPGMISTNNSVQNSEVSISSSPSQYSTSQQFNSQLPQSSISSQPQNQPNQASEPQFVIHGLKFHYDEPKELVCEEEDEEYCSAKKPIVKTKMSTVTLIQQKTLPPKTILKTVTRMVVPETVVKTSTHILKAEPITITQKPDTVVRYVTPKTVTKLKQIPPETITVTKTKVKKVTAEVSSEENYVPPSIRVKNSNDIPEIESEDDNYLEKDLKTPKGVECVPDCSCEEEQNCENDCQEIRCEIIE